MTETREETGVKKEAMKKLRRDRKAKIKAAKALMKEQQKTIKAIKEQLRDRPMTVPEIAATTGIEASSVLWFLAALKKYGKVVEGEKEGSYFKFRLAEKTSEGSTLE
jgi:predicted transcriptional regulator